MKIDRLRVGSVGVVAPHGAITQAEADELVAAIESTRQSAAGRIVLDMSDVPYADSRILETMLDFADRQRSDGQAAKLAGLTETCREILDLTELLGEFEVFDSVDSAVRSFL
ncbi:MAG TPA: STAS domain-containing protein [Phycisphaerae bacterium]|nr:STAS domain-containing protein [Phycisphaerae bacterium]